MGIYNIRIINEQTYEAITLSSSSSNFKIYADGLEGFDAPNFNIYSESSAIYDNSFIVGENTPDRNLTIKMRTADNESVSTKLQTLYQILNEKDTYKIRIYTSIQVAQRVITGAKLEGIKAQPSNLECYINVTLGFYCPNPYWEDINPTSKTLTASGTSYNIYTFTEEERSAFFEKCFPSFNALNVSGSVQTITSLEFIIYNSTFGTKNILWSGNLSLGTNSSIVLNLQEKTFLVGNTSLIGGVTSFKNLDNMYLSNSSSLNVRLKINGGSVSSSLYNTSLSYKKRFLSCF